MGTSSVKKPEIGFADTLNSGVSEGNASQGAKHHTV